jgi:hypothetical protein
MWSNESEYWDKQPDITEEVFEYSKEFTRRFDGDEKTFDYSELSLTKAINEEIEQYDKWDLTQTEARIYWAQLLAYVAATLCRLFEGKCVGELYKNNPGPSYYCLRVKLHGKYYNIEDGIGRACDRQYEFVSYYEHLKHDVLGNETRMSQLISDSAESFS